MPTRNSAATATAAIATLTALLCLAGCDGGREPASTDSQAPIGKLASRLETFERRASDCTGEQQCAVVSVTREVFEQRPALNKAILESLIRQLQGNGEDRASAINLEEVADQFLAEAARAEGISSARWQLTGEAQRLSRRKKLLTVEIGTYLYTGGAHGIPTVNWLNWDLAANEWVSLEQVIREGEGKAFWRAAEAAHRRWLRDQPGADLEYRKSWPFQRSEDFRLDDEGLVLQYDVYVLGPYALGPVQLTIPWEDLRGVIRARYLPGQVTE